MNMIKHISLLNLFIALSCFGLSAKPQKKLNSISVQTKNSDVICTLQPLSKLEAKEVFGSTGPMDSLPHDTYFVDGNGIKTHLNGFSNLHCRYLILEISIKNSSPNAIAIPHVKITGENYLKIQDITFEPLSNIVNRYDINGIIMKGIMFGLSSLSFLGAAGLFTMAYQKQHEKIPFIIFGSASAALASIFAFVLHASNQREDAYTSLSNLLALINDEPSENEHEETIIIPAGGTYKDLVFINNETYKNALKLLNEPTNEKELIYEVIDKKKIS